MKKDTLVQTKEPTITNDMVFVIDKEGKHIEMHKNVASKLVGAGVVKYI